MFQESLVESTPLLRTRNRWPVFISVAAQATILTLAIAIPLLHPEVLPTHPFDKLAFLPSPVRPRTPPPPPPQVHLQAAPASNAPSAPQLQQSLIPSLIPEPSTSDLPPIDNVIIAMNPGPAHASGPFVPMSAPPAPHVTPTTVAPKGPLSISEGVLAGNLLAPIRPEYPAIAKAAGVQGTVIIQAIISRTGTIESAHVVSGPAMLQSAAMNAVRNARYRPYLLDHQPTEVETTFTINFHMGS